MPPRGRDATRKEQAAVGAVQQGLTRRERAETTGLPAGSIEMDRGVLVAETHHGLICANAGVDESNVARGGTVTLLPVDSDASAAAIRAAIAERAGVDVAVIISDTFGRPWREGQVNVAIGAAGIAPLADYAGQDDGYGYRMQASIIAVADELASAAELVMGKIDAVPAEELALKRRKLKRAAKAEVHCLSAVAHQGLEPVLGMVLALVQERRAKAEAA